jgi:hypothetical protein
MLGNVIFGLFPLIIMYLFFFCSNGKVCGDGVDNLIYEGAILFVCIAIVGTVYVDFYLSGIYLSGWGRFATYFFPVIIPLWVSVNYVLIHMKIIGKEVFAASSGITIATIALSFLYVLFVKTNLYMQEDLRHETK